MKISCIDIYKFNIPLIHKVVVPIGTLDAAENVVVRITSDNGTVGWGEASPFAPITGDTQESNYANAHLACARPNIAFLDLDSAFILNSDPVQGGITFDANIGGGIHLPDTAGLGASFDAGFPQDCEHYSVEA